MDRLKIVHIVPSLASGGAERITVDICNELSNRHDIFIIQIMTDTNPKYSFYKNQLSPNVTYLNLKGGEGKIIDLKCVIKVIRILKNIQPQVFHSHLNIVYSFLASFLFYRINFFHTIHNDAEKECVAVKGISLKKIVKFFFKFGFIQPITISEASRDSFINFYNIENPLIIKNGCAQKFKSEKFDLVSYEIANFKQHKDDLVFLNIGRCADQKNHKMLIQVFNRLIEDGHKVVLLIIGDGFDSLMGRDIKLKAKKGIHFLGPKQNVSDYYYASDAFCLSSKYEGLPITLLEAISAGCLPICTPAGGIPEVLANGIGLVSKDFSEDAYYKALSSFLSQEGSIVKKDLQKYFKMNYSIKSTANNLEKIYN
jgi:glycosyltransferase involved in cell wall biosynthesis